MRAAHTLYLLCIVWPVVVVIGCAGMVMGISRYIAQSIFHIWSPHE